MHESACTYTTIISYIYRSSHSVKHFIVSVDNGDLVLGKEHFSDLDSLEEHFDNNPMLGDNNGRIWRFIYHYI